MSDPLRERLDRIAGISLRAPRAEYVITGLPFGEAKLRRNTGTGRWDALLLLLTPAAAADVEKAGGSRAGTVYYPLEHWLAQGATFQGEVDVVAARLHALLVDDGLLSRPELLTSAASIDPGLGLLAAAALEGLRSALSRTTRRITRCPVCAERRSTLDPRFSQRNTQYSEQTEILRMLGIILPGRGQLKQDEPEPECPHAAMRRLAFQRLCEEHPELGFEAALLLIPVTVSDSPRFVLSPMTLKPMLDEWLTPNAPDDDYDDYDEFTAEPRHVVVPKAAPGDSTLTPGQRGALAFATQSWEAGGALAGYLPPANDASHEMPVMSSEVTPPEVALLWPEGVARPAPKLPPPAPPPPPPPPPAKPAATKREKAVPSSPTPAPTPAPTPTPGQELMTSELRALGYTEAMVKKLLKEGTLERAGYGWFRWKG